VEEKEEKVKIPRHEWCVFCGSFINTFITEETYQKQQIVCSGE
jgi:hypothetical protein